MRRTQRGGSVAEPGDWLASIKVMEHLEELKFFIYERLHAVTSEILGVIEKAMTDCKDQASRLKQEDGHRNGRPLFDKVVKFYILYINRK